MERMIEVCAGSYQDCIAAYQGSAKRVELRMAQFAKRTQKE